jgi:tetratricopeptide (TPR) repeat protein
MSEQPLPDRTVDLSGPDEALDAALAAAFGPDSGPPLPAGASVLRALGAVLPDVPRVQLRDPASGAGSPIVRPRSEEVPAADPAGRYQLHGEIARGGMGAILKGRDVDLGRDIAVKVLLETHQGKTELLQRFVEEAQISGQLQHPGIVPVYELGQFPDKRPYFTMKLVKGQTLAKLLDERNDRRLAGRTEDGTTSEPPIAIDLPPFLKVFEQVCQTLAYAHARGVIHRDLKPSNVMVGAFGEVQVMDWGLAKVLAEGGVADEAKTRVRQEVSVIRTRRSDGSEGSSSPGSQTQAGSILGTPAYMAPEQARGEVELVDERADVFGLGAILCEILTGQPPFTGKAAEAQRKAQMAKLADAHARLDGCRADGELIELAKRCLAAEPWDRPRHAGAVAAALTAYQQSVAERLRLAEVERAAAEARAQEEKNTRQMAEARAREERKRRRATLALAAAVLALVVAGGGAAAWWWQERTALVRDVDAALAEAKTHQQAARWPEVRAALERADGRLGGRGPAELRARVRQARLDADMVAELEAIRLESSEGLKGKFDYAAAEARYAPAFARYGISVDALSPAEAAARVRESAVREELLAGLDYWRWARGMILTDLGFTYLPADLSIQTIVPDGAIAADRRPLVGDQIIGIGEGKEGPLVDVRGKGVRELARLSWGMPGTVVRLQVVSVRARESRVYTLTRGGKVWNWLKEVVWAAEDNAWRRAFRQAVAVKDVEKVRALAKQAGALEQPPTVLTWLGCALRDAGLAEEAATFLRQAQQRHPGDFWLNYHLGVVLDTSVRPRRSQEAAGYLRAALAIRRVPAAWNALGIALQHSKDFDGGIAAFRQGVILAPQTSLLHYNLGNALRSKGDLDAAIAAFRQAIALDPKYAAAHTNLGNALQAKGDLDAAIAAYRQAITLSPKLAQAYNNLGIALRAKGDVDGAIAAYREAIDLNPKYAQAHYSLGNALKAKGDLDAVIAAYRQAITLNPKDAKAHYNLGSALRAKGELEGAVAAYRQAITLDPKHAQAHNNLGNALDANGDPDGAVAAFRRAIALNPKLAEAHNNLGTALHAKGDLDGAVAAYRQAITVNPKNAAAHQNLAWILATTTDFPRRDPKQAVLLAQKAVELAPKEANNWTTLGAAHYRDGNLKEAALALEKALTLRPDGNGSDWFFLAMTRWRLGEKDAARQCYEKAVAWMGKHQPSNDELRRFRAEAAELLGLPAGEPARKEDGK